MNEQRRVAVCSSSDVDAGCAVRVDVDGLAICVARGEDGVAYALRDVCTHEETPMSDGWVYEHFIECPLHNSVFDLRTGSVESLPATEPLEMLTVTESDGQILVDVRPWPAHEPQVPPMDKRGPSTR